VLSLTVSAADVPPVVAVVGPTAAGKSGLAIDLAIALDGEVVNADSMQLYRGMDVGTAKLTTAERLGIPHHLLDIWDVRRTADVASYQRLARAAVDAIRAAGRTPIVVGGSGLYLRAVLDDLDFPGTDPDVRAALEADLAKDGSPALHARLAELDADTAEAIDPANGRRIVRAMEVISLQGRFTARMPAPQSRDARTVYVGLDIPRDALDQRIADRVDRMWAAGLVDEVRHLAEDHGLRQGRTASRALGYAQVLRFLDGELTEDAARDETMRATRRFARRQGTWFRPDARISWLPYDAPDLVTQVLAAI
jgi:tRNA dimethylallyltransferase